MADVGKLKPFLLKWEGGFVDDLNDLGGATNKGVTLVTYKVYCKKKGLPDPTVEDLQELSDDDWTDILKTMYWNRWKADEIHNQSIANLLVDWVWSSGINGIKKPQALLGVKDDGIVGANTLTALNNNPLHPRELFNKIKQSRFDFIDSICRVRPANEKFRKGWYNRIDDIKFSE